MLVLSRKAGEAIRIGDSVVVKVVRIHGNRIKLAIDAPKDIPVHRGEREPPKEG